MRIGLVGYGHGGRHFHAPLIASLPGATFVGVVTLSAERRQLLAAEHPGVRAFDSIEQLVAAGIDGLVISTPLEGRAALVLEAIERGVPVVSDKPFASDLEQAKTLIEAAQTRRVPLSVYMNRRWDSDFLTLRKLIASGAWAASAASSRGSSAMCRRPWAIPAAAGSCATSAAIWWTRPCSCSAR